MIFSHFTLSQQVLSESCTFCAITGKRKFAFSTVASFSRQKPLKSKNKNDTIVSNKKFYHCAKFELYRIKDAKVFPSMQLRALSWPCVNIYHFEWAKFTCLAERDFTNIITLKILSGFCSGHVGGDQRTHIKGWHLCLLHSQPNC